MIIIQKNIGVGLDFLVSQYLSQTPIMGLRIRRSRVRDNLGCMILPDGAELPSSGFEPDLCQTAAKIHQNSRKFVTADRVTIIKETLKASSLLQCFQEVAKTPWMALRGQWGTPVAVRILSARSARLQTESDSSDLLYLDPGHPDELLPLNTMISNLHQRP